jgi:hypothetical protein
MSEPDVVTQLDHWIERWNNGKHPYDRPAPLIERARDEIMALRDERNGYGDALQKSRDEIVALRGQLNQGTFFVAVHGSMSEQEAEQFQNAQHGPVRLVSEPHDNTFAARIRAEALEEAAQLVEARPEDPGLGMSGGLMREAQVDTCRQLATDIRALKERRDE